MKTCCQHQYEVLELKKEVEYYKKLYFNANATYEKLSTNLRRYFTEDQMNALLNSSGSVQEWGVDSVKKSVMLKSFGGSRALNFTIQHIAPMPTVRTVQRNLENLTL